MRGGAAARGQRDAKTSRDSVSLHSLRRAKDRASSDVLVGFFKCPPRPSSTPRHAAKALGSSRLPRTPPPGCAGGGPCLRVRPLETALGWQRRAGMGCAGASPRTRARSTCVQVRVGGPRFWELPQNMVSFWGLNLRLGPKVLSVNY